MLIEFISPQRLRFLHLENLLIRPYHMQAVHRFGLLLQMLHVA